MDITITGTRDVGRSCDSLFVSYVAPFVREGSGFFVGGAIGIDTLALQWLSSQGANVTVVVPAMVDDQPADAKRAIRTADVKVVELHHPAFPNAEAYHARNRYMVDRSALVIGFPLKGHKSGGTRYTLSYAASRGVPHMIVAV